MSKHQGAGASPTETNQKCFNEAVFEKEIEHIRRRRRQIVHSSNNHHPQCDPRIEKDADLVGLAFSGGGIRSATFCLGVLQGLAEKTGFLKHIDYLSTVSGGGYIGAWFLALVHSFGIDDAERRLNPDCESNRIHDDADGIKPKATSPGETSSTAQYDGKQSGHHNDTPIGHLRKYSNYLAPNAGLFTVDTWSLVVIYLRNLLATQLCVVPFVLFAFVVLQMFANRIGETFTLLLVAGIPALGILCLSVLGLGTLLIRGKYSQRKREDQARTSAACILLCILSTSVLGTALYGQSVVSWITQSGRGLLGTSLFGTWLLSTLTSLFAGQSSRFSGKDRQRVVERLAAIGPYVFFFGLGCVLSSVAAWCLDPGSDWKVFNYDLGDYLQITVYVVFFGSTIAAAVLSNRININDISLNDLYANRLARCFLDVQQTNGRNDGKAQLFESELWISDLGSKQISAGNTDATLSNPTPFPIINTALNLTAASDLAKQERRAESFVLTPTHVGCQSLGWREGFWDKLAGRGRVSRLIAISGAAANPNMGYHSSPGVTALLTFFNVRLGWWLPNPSLRTKFTERPSFLAKWMLKEFTGFTDSKDTFVNLSDGGHFENLGVYELVRRHCRLIIAVDAEADPELKFHGLGTLIRRCRNDFGIDIEIDIDPLRRDPATGHSRQHCVVGTIRYDRIKDNSPENKEDRTLSPVGTLLYIKASLTGDENTDVVQYAERHPQFPHEPTLDQFFSESQFESYRALGHHCILDSLRDVLDGRFHTDTYESQDANLQKHLVEQIVYNLRHTWFPVPQGTKRDFQAAVQPFVELHQRFQDDGASSRIAKELYAELTTVMGSEAEKETHSAGSDVIQREVHTAILMLQVLENAWFTLQLDRRHADPINSGWMNVFFRWSQTPGLREYWPVLRHEFSRDFVRFCEESADFPQTTRAMVAWNEIAETQRKEIHEEFLKDFKALEQTELELTYDQFDRFARAPKDHGTIHFVCVNANRRQLPVGLVRIHKRLDRASEYRKAFYELIVWIRPRFRNQGHGKWVFQDEHSPIHILIQQQMDGANHNIPIKILIPAKIWSRPTDSTNKARVLTFLYRIGFRLEGDGDTNYLLLK
jgi:predicted acylesterase/phospholipase RssA